MIDVLIIQLSYVVTHLPFLYSLLLRCVVFERPFFTCRVIDFQNSVSMIIAIVQCNVYFISLVESFKVCIRRYFLASDLHTKPSYIMTFHSVSG